MPNLTRTSKLAFLFFVYITVWYYYSTRECLRFQGTRQFTTEPLISTNANAHVIPIPDTVKYVYINIGTNLDPWPSCGSPKFPYNPEVRFCACGFFVVCIVRSSVLHLSLAILYFRGPST